MYRRFAKLRSIRTISGASPATSAARPRADEPARRPKGVCTDGRKQEILRPYRGA